MSAPGIGPVTALRFVAAIDERRGRPVAAVALARKLAGILFAMWRDGTSYQSKRSAEAVMHG